MILQRGICVCGHSKDDHAFFPMETALPACRKGWILYGQACDCTEYVDKAVEEAAQLTIEEEYELIAAGTAPDWEEQLPKVVTEILRNRLR